MNNVSHPLSFSSLSPFVFVSKQLIAHLEGRVVTMRPIGYLGQQPTTEQPQESSHTQYNRYIQAIQSNTPSLFFSSYL